MPEGGPHNTLSLLISSLMINLGDSTRIMGSLITPDRDFREMGHPSLALRDLQGEPSPEESRESTPLSLLDSVMGYLAGPPQPPRIHPGRGALLNSIHGLLHKIRHPSFQNFKTDRTHDQPLEHALGLKPGFSDKARGFLDQITCHGLIALENKVLAQARISAQGLGSASYPLFPQVFNLDSDQVVWLESLGQTHRQDLPERSRLTPKETMRLVHLYRKYQGSLLGLYHMIHTRHLPYVLRFVQIYNRSKRLLILFLMGLIHQENVREATIIDCMEVLPYHLQAHHMREFYQRAPSTGVRSLQWLKEYGAEVHKTYSDLGLVHLVFHGYCQEHRFDLILDQAQTRRKTLGVPESPGRLTYEHLYQLALDQWGRTPETLETIEAHKTYARVHLDSSDPLTMYAGSRDGVPIRIPDPGPQVLGQFLRTLNHTTPIVHEWKGPKPRPPLSVVMNRIWSQITGLGVDPTPTRSR